MSNLVMLRMTASTVAAARAVFRAWRTPPLLLPSSSLPRPEVVLPNIGHSDDDDGHKKLKSSVDLMP